MAVQSAQNKALVNLLKTGAYSDLTISCGKDQYRVHKAIICPRSHFFEAACDGKFKEAQTSSIDLPDDDPVAVRMMIEYLYHDTYTPPNRDGAVGTPTSATDNNEEKDKRKRELCDAAVVENKRTKRPDALPEDSRVYSSQPVPPPFGGASTPPPPPPAASHQRGRGSGRSRRGRGSLPGFGSAPAQNGFQGSPNQSSHSPSSFRFGSSAPAPTPPPPPGPSAPQRPAPPSNLHIHTKVYTLGEKYGIEPLKALALSKFEFETQNTVQRDDFLAATREAYTSTIETDRPLRDAIVTFLRKNKHLLTRDYMKAVLKETDLGFDLLMELASE